MSERPIEHGQLTRNETCDGSLGWKQKFRRVELGERISILQANAEVCNGCGTERELTPEPLKWVWHKETCENPGNVILLLSLHGFVGSWGEAKEHFDMSNVKCGDCGQTAKILSERRECYCQVQEF